MKITSPTAITLTGRWFYGGTPCADEPGAFHEVHGQVLADLGNSYLLVRLISWRTHEPAPGDQVVHLNVVCVGQWEFFDSREQLTRYIDQVVHGDQDDDAGDGKVVPLTRH
jgi:hypothetical protein